MAGTERGVWDARRGAGSRCEFLSTRERWSEEAQGCWLVKQRRAAPLQRGLPRGCLQRACRKEGKAVAGIQCRLKGPKFRSDIQGDARKSTRDFSLPLQLGALQRHIQLQFLCDPQWPFVSERGEKIPLQARPPRHKATRCSKGRNLGSGRPSWRGKK